MDNFEEVLKFAALKHRLFFWLNSGIAAKVEWDNLIREAHDRGYVSSEAQLRRYYDRYGIGLLPEGQS